jgi:hypothetical protein
MVDLEQIRLEAVSLGDGTCFRGYLGRLIVTAVEVVPERQVRAPPHLHQRRHFGPRSDRLDTRYKRLSRVALGLPVT